MKVSQIFVCRQRIIVKDNLSPDYRNDEHADCDDCEAPFFAADNPFRYPSSSHFHRFAEHPPGSRAGEKKDDNQAGYFIAREKDVKNVEPESRVGISGGNGPQPEGERNSDYGKSSDG